MFLSKILPDPFTSSLIGTVLLASLLPVSGDLAAGFDMVTKAAIGALFFLHGAKLSREALKAGATHWRLHACVALITFVLFPLLGLALKSLAPILTTPELYLGILFLCALPSTVQSSIALTAMAKGNVPAAICSASASTMIGIFLTPVIAGMLMATHSTAGGSLSSIMAVVMQLLLPFLAGQFARPWIGGWVDRHKNVLKLVDQGAILLVVYTAFSASVKQGLWERLPLPALGGLAIMVGTVLAIVLVVSRAAARRLGFNTADEVTVVFCGTQKSLASGVPIAKVLFPVDVIGTMVLPLMLYHQMQLMVCAVIAQRYARRETAPCIEEKPVAAAARRTL